MVLQKNILRNHISTIHSNTIPREAINIFYLQNHEMRAIHTYRFPN